MREGDDTGFISFMEFPADFLFGIYYNFFSGNLSGILCGKDAANNKRNIGYDPYNSNGITTNSGRIPATKNVITQKYAW